MPRDWRPAMWLYDTIRTAGKVPNVGDVIGYLFDRQAWRMLEVEEVHFANWHAQTVDAWHKAGEPDAETWDGRERKAFCEPAHKPLPSGKDRRGLTVYPWASNSQWWPLTEPYPVCVDCGKLWPCPCDDANKTAAKALKELERVGSIMPGCCWACGEPITAQQKSIEFPGENLALPGADAPVFHIAASRKSHRGTCRSEADAYEQAWVAASPGRPIRLRCTGVLFRHERTSECTRADECPGVDADHRDYAHCVTLVGTKGKSTVYVHDGRGLDDGRYEIHRPLTNCGVRGCRGPKAPADAFAIAAEGTDHA